MTNKEALQRIEQAFGARIEKLFWIAGSIESSEFREFLDDIEEEDWKKILPEETSTDYFEDYLLNGEVVEFLIDNQKYGFICEINLPDTSNFSFNEKGRPISWSVHPGSCFVEILYADNLEELVEKIELTSSELFEVSVEEYKNNNR